jgi:hypothetical protein
MTTAENNSLTTDIKEPKTTVKAPSKVSTKIVPKAVVKTTASALLQPAAKVIAKPALKLKEEKLAKIKKPKLVRDSFTMPKAEYAVLDELKQRATKLTSQVKKTELIRAGIKALAGLSDAAFLTALKAVPTIKTGRPSKSKAPRETEQSQ